MGYLSPVVRLTHWVAAAAAECAVEAAECAAVVVHSLPVVAAAAAQRIF